MVRLIRSQWMLHMNRRASGNILNTLVKTKRYRSVRSTERPKIWKVIDKQIHHVKKLTFTGDFLGLTLRGEAYSMQRVIFRWEFLPHIFVDWVWLATVEWNKNFGCYKATDI
jgi:hypothetical protein